MELIPKAYIAGVLTTLGLQGSSTPVITADKLNRIWSEVAPRYGYTQLQVTPDYSAATFLGVAPEMGVAIQPPLLQVRDPITMTAEQSAEKAQSIFKVIARHLGAQQFLNLGVKHIYHAPAPGGDARGFILGRVLQKDDGELGDLKMGGTIWAGLKFVSIINSAMYTVLVEPLQLDNKFVFLDVDVQFPGELDLDRVKVRSREAEEYLTGSVASYLDRFI